MTAGGTRASRVVVFVQENKTVDFLFPSLAAWGARVKPWGTPLRAAPAHDQPHDRNAWVHYAIGDYPGLRVSVNDEIVVPLYSWLAKNHTFCDHHFGAGSNSTSGHLLAFTGQTPTFKNPPFTGTHPVWDLPTVFGLAQRAGISWGAFVDADSYPVKLIRELSTEPMVANVHGPGEFLARATAGTLPTLSYVWSPAGFDEHPPFAKPVDPDYLTKGHDLVWREIATLVAPNDPPPLKRQ